MKPFALLPAIIALLVLTGCATSTLTTVDSVDLKRYSGKWYEIARIPNTFQRDCTGTVTAEYAPLPNGKIQVINACQKSDGTWKSVKGTATPVAGSNNTKLKVNFGVPFITGDYWIIALDQKSYQWALVGHPSRNYLWILSRSPKIPDSLYNQIIQIAREKGYDTGRIMKTK
jgi:apolipoprotein D and lipocalin family protein